MSRKLPAIQVLRGFAALLVVVHHSIRAVTVNKGDSVFAAPLFVDNPAVMQFGAAGVDIFFVLSGFLMVWISSSGAGLLRGPGDFLRDRVVRIWPLYALVTIIVLLPALFRFMRHGVVNFDLQAHRLLGIIFIPSRNASGALQPALGVGWTLNYEMAFYLAFAAAIAIRVGPLWIRLIAVFACWPLVAIVANNDVLTEFFGNPLIVEFLFGALVAFLARRQTPIPSMAILLPSGVAMLLVGSAYEVGFPRVGTCGVGAILLLLVALKSSLRDEDWAFPQWLGDVSYSLYLVHILVIYQLMLPVLRGSRLLPEVAVVILVGVSVAVAAVVYRYVEAPLLKFFRTRFGSKGLGTV